VLIWHIRRGISPLETLHNRLLMLWGGLSLVLLKALHQTLFLLQGHGRVRFILLEAFYCILLFLQSWLDFILLEALIQSGDRGAVLIDLELEDCNAAVLLVNLGDELLNVEKLLVVLLLELFYLLCGGHRSCLSAIDKCLLGLNRSLQLGGLGVFLLQRRRHVDELRVLGRNCALEFFHSPERARQSGVLAFVVTVSPAGLYSAASWGGFKR
jgi:hypothetical protein